MLLMMWMPAVRWNGRRAPLIWSHSSLNKEYTFADKKAVRDYFVRLTGLFKNLNYAAEQSPAYNDLHQPN
jgi:hypothetical protein